MLDHPMEQGADIGVASPGRLHGDVFWTCLKNQEEDLENSLFCSLFDHQFTAT